MLLLSYIFFAFETTFAGYSSLNYIDLEAAEDTGIKVYPGFKKFEVAKCSVLLSLWFKLRQVKAEKVLESWWSAASPSPVDFGDEETLCKKRLP